MRPSGTKAGAPGREQRAGGDEAQPPASLRKSSRWNSPHQLCPASPRHHARPCRSLRWLCFCLWPTFLGQTSGELAGRPSGHEKVPMAVSGSCASSGPHQQCQTSSPPPWPCQHQPSSLGVRGTRFPGKLSQAWPLPTGCWFEGSELGSSCTVDASDLPTMNQKLTRHKPGHVPGPGCPREESLPQGHARGWCSAKPPRRFSALRVPECGAQLPTLPTGLLRHPPALLSTARFRAWLGWPGRSGHSLH